MEAEAALEYYDNPRTFTHKDCKQCGRSFATRGAPVAYCSDPCRVRNFEERMGVKWQPLREPSDRWGFMGQPLTVPHEALIVVQAVMAEQAAAEPTTPIVVVQHGVHTEIDVTDDELLDIFGQFGIE